MSAVTEWWAGVQATALPEQHHLADADRCMDHTFRAGLAGMVAVLSLALIVAAPDWFGRAAGIAFGGTALVLAARQVLLAVRHRPVVVDYAPAEVTEEARRGLA